MPPEKKRKPVIAALSIVVVVLFAFSVIQQAFNLTPFLGTPGKQTVLLLWALMSLNVILLFIFSLILLRQLLKLFFERKSQRLGSQFQTKLVAAFLALILFPVTFLSMFGYFLINRNLDKWFSRPVDEVLLSLQKLVAQVQIDTREDSLQTARYLSNHPVLRNFLLSSEPKELPEVQDLAEEFGVRTLLVLDKSHVPVLLFHDKRLYKAPQPEFREITEGLGLLDWTSGSVVPNQKLYTQLIGNPDKSDSVYHIKGGPFAETLLAGDVVHSEDFEPLGYLFVAVQVPPGILSLAKQVTDSNQQYEGLVRERKLIRSNYLLWLGLITLLVLFAAVWVGLYLSRRIAVPIRALAEASNEVSRGNLLVQVNCPADDELGILVSSFNRMTAELYEGSQKLERANRELQESNLALDERNRYTEAVLENIPSGVISINSTLGITKMNRPAEQILGCSFAASPLSVEDVFHPEDMSEVKLLLDKAGRVGIASKDMPLRLRGRSRYFSITVSSLDLNAPVSLGFVMVLEDLTEVLKAQKASAWKEVARRMAHEIKNPLTPIQLSADRIRKNLEKSKADVTRRFSDPEFERVINDCVQTITEEVTVLKGMVDEFSRFARLPTTNPVPCNLNGLIEGALSSYNGRFEGIAVRAELATLPEIPLDPEQFRRVFVNLFDNAIEAMEDSEVKELTVESRFLANKETVCVVVKDSGHGIQSIDKEKLFLPYFSTRKRGTGLGLAIVSQIIADHKGFIHAEDNHPNGTAFVIEIPSR
ncbi:MAG: ATP-binding protein [Acidobacteriota bacterium]